MVAVEMVADQKIAGQQREEIGFKCSSLSSDGSIRIFDCFTAYCQFREINILHNR